MKQTPRKVFVSYSHDREDKEWTRQFVSALEKRDIDVWFDERNLVAGEKLIPAIERGLRNSDLVVMLLTEKNAGRPNVLFEYGAALGLGKRVVAIVPQEMSADKVPVALRLRRYLTKDNPEETAAKLLNETNGSNGGGAPD